METIKIILVLGAISASIVFLIKYYFYTDEHEMPFLAQPLQLTIFAIAIIAGILSSFDIIALLFLLAVAALSYFRNLRLVTTKETALLYTIWQLLCMAALALVILFLLAMTTNKRKGRRITRRYQTRVKKARTRSVKAENGEGLTLASTAIKDADQVGDIEAHNAATQE